jgi:hypothetical protein
MTSRERVLAAIDHQEPDRVPLDLGGSFVTGIHAQSLHHLRRRLGLEDRPVKLHDAVQMLAEVEMDVVERLHLDVLPIEPLNMRMGLASDRGKLWQLFDGSPVLVPSDFDLELSGDEWLLHLGEGDRRRPVYHMPVGGYYFDTIDYGAWHHDYRPPDLDGLRRASANWRVTDESLDFARTRAEELRRSTDKALHLNCWGTLGMRYVGHLTDFLCLLADDPGYVRELFDISVAAAIENLKLLWQAVGDNADLIFITGLDFGSQRAELFSRDTFREVYLPALKAHFDWVHENTTWRCFEHSCGSIPGFVADLADAGLDVLNPIQTSAAGMDPAWLKETVGDRLTFWGGGVETQGVLQFGTPEQVREQVAERIRIFAPGGGFVFNPDHNIQPKTPPENIITAFETALELGQY